MTDKRWYLYAGLVGMSLFFGGLTHAMQEGGQFGQQEGGEEEEQFVPQEEQHREREGQRPPVVGGYTFKAHVSPSGSGVFFKCYPDAFEAEPITFELGGRNKKAKFDRAIPFKDAIIVVTQQTFVPKVTKKGKVVRGEQRGEERGQQELEEGEKKNEQPETRYLFTAYPPSPFKTYEVTASTPGGLKRPSLLFTYSRVKNVLTDHEINFARLLGWAKQKNLWKKAEATKVEPNTGDLERANQWVKFASHWPDVPEALKAEGKVTTAFATEMASGLTEEKVEKVGLFDVPGHAKLAKHIISELRAARGFKGISAAEWEKIYRNMKAETSAEELLAQVAEKIQQTNPGHFIFTEDGAKLVATIVYRPAIQALLNAQAEYAAIKKGPSKEALADQFAELQQQVQALGQKPAGEVTAAQFSALDAALKALQTEVQRGGGEQVEQLKQQMATMTQQLADLAKSEPIKLALEAAQKARETAAKEAQDRADAAAHQAIAAATAGVDTAVANVTELGTKSAEILANLDAALIVAYNKFADINTTGCSQTVVREKETARVAAENKVSPKKSEILAARAELDRVAREEAARLLLAQQKQEKTTALTNLKVGVTEAVAAAAQEKLGVELEALRGILNGLNAAERRIQELGDLKPFGEEQGGLHAQQQAELAKLTTAKDRVNAAIAAKTTEAQRLEQQRREAEEAQRREEARLEQERERERIAREEALRQQPPQPGTVNPQTMYTKYNPVNFAEIKDLNQLRAAIAELKQAAAIESDKKVELQDILAEAQVSLEVAEKAARLAQ